MKKRIQETLKKLSPAEKVLLIAAAAGLALLAALSSRDKGSAAELQRIEQQVADTQRKVRALQDEDMPGLSARLRELQGQSVTFPKKSEAEAAEVALWYLAEANNVGLVRTTYSISDMKAGEWQLPQHIFAVEGVGLLPDIIGYLESIEGSPFRVVQTDSWTLTPSGPQLWRFTFTVTIWSEGQKAAATPTPGPK